MIGTSPSEYLFIRACVFFLRAITPLCLLYWVARFVRPAAFRAPVIIDLWTAAEALFYLLFYVPRKYHLLQRAALHPPALSRDQRWRLFERCSTNIPDYERYLRGWFNDAPLSEIKRENLKEFLTWAFLNTGDVAEMSDDEFERYIRDIEKRLGSEIETGRGNAKCLRLSLDKVSMSHRSLIWYLVSILPHLSKRVVYVSVVCLRGRHHRVHPPVVLQVLVLSHFSSPLLFGLPASRAQLVCKEPHSVKLNHLLVQAAYRREETSHRLHPRHWHWPLSLCELLARDQRLQHQHRKR